MNHPAAWRRLPRAQQRRIVAALARRLRDDPPPDFQRWGVVSVGYGWRIRQSRNRILRDVLVLSLSVRRKQRASGLAVTRRIPRRWPVTATVDGRRGRVHVPIDVCETLRRVRTHDGDPVPRLDVTSVGMPTARGAACVLLRDAGQRRWLLSCHHVLGNSNFNPVLEPDWAAAVLAEARDRSRVLAEEREFASLQPGGYDCVDAGLCRVEPDALSPGDWSTYPVAAATRQRFLNDATGTPRVCTPRNRVLDVRFLKLDYDFQMNYRSGASAFMREVALFEVAPAQESPVGGDSGSPVIGRAGVWLGMHIGGGQLPMREGGALVYRSVSVVLPSYVLLDRDTFGRAVSLST